MVVGFELIFRKQGKFCALKSGALTIMTQPIVEVEMDAFCSGYKFYSISRMAVIVNCIFELCERVICRLPLLAGHHINCPPPTLDVSRSRSRPWRIRLSSSLV